MSSHLTGCRTGGGRSHRPNDTEGVGDGDSAHWCQPDGKPAGLAVPHTGASETESCSWVAESSLASILLLLLLALTLADPGAPDSGAHLGE